MRKTKRPDEVWFRWHGPDAAWEWSFDPPRKRDEGRWTRLVREDQDKARHVAAPELLAALRELLSPESRLHLRSEVPSDVLLRAHAAIAKAEGRE